MQVTTFFLAICTKVTEGRIAMIVASQRRPVPVSRHSAPLSRDIRLFN